MHISVYLTLIFNNVGLDSILCHFQVTWTQVTQRPFSNFHKEPAEDIELEVETEEDPPRG